jgi:hypothetical protein
MYTKSEFMKAASHVPDDYDTKSEEFWSYVSDKLHAFRGRIVMVFVESLSKDTKEALSAVLGGEGPGFSLISDLLKDGAKLKPTEDPILVAETESWLQMIERSSNATLREFIEQNLTERNHFISDLVGRSLGEGEAALLMIDSRRKLELPKDVRVIRVLPFDPADYLNVSVIKARLRSKATPEATDAGR